MACFSITWNVDVNKCLNELWKILPLARPKSGIKKLDKEMARLRAKSNDIKNQITEAQREETIPTNEVSQWLREVDILEAKVADINQDFQSMSCFSYNCFRKSSNCCSIVTRVAKKLGEATELMNRADALDPIATVRPLEPTVIHPISHQPVGIELKLDQIVTYINGGEGNIIGIYGMGGIGKTTLLKSIQQHYLRTHAIFDCVIWAVASKDCQLKRLQMDIAKSVGLQILQENDDEQTCGDKLFRYLKDKKCLLFLDDIWKHVDLQLLGMAHSDTERGQQQQQPCKVVVFTTRRETVCNQMKAKKKIKVKCLGPDEAWQLFEQNSDKEFLRLHRGISLVAHQLAEECAGIPLALITVARAMSEKKSLESWRLALGEIRDEHDWTTIGVSEDSLVMYKAFKLSYDSLENDSIRECLLCCTLWPEDYEIDKFDDLIPGWIGCGIIREFDVINKAFDKGCFYLDALMAASLLEYCNWMHPAYTYVKMHDVIRDMALLMVSGLEGNRKKWIVKTGLGLWHLPVQEVWHDAERVSFMRNEIASLEEYYGASTFPNLSVLFLQYNPIPKEISRSFFPSMPYLTHLDLYRCGILELPKEISSLTVLEYLNLSRNPIRRLPAELGCLGKLKYLLLSNTGLKRGLNGTISNLSMLKWLEIKNISGVSEWWWDELKCFQGRHLLSVAIEIDATTTNIVRLDMLPNISIWDLTVDGYRTSELPDLDLRTLQWSYNITCNLEFLTFQSVEVDILMLSSHESSFGRLKKLVLNDLRHLEKISWNGVGLFYLCELNISNCHKLEDVSWILLLSNLAILMIAFCPAMKELISDVGNSGSMSSIHSMSFFNMPNLNCIANQPLQFPLLEYMLVSECPKLTKLSFGAEMLNSALKEIEGEETWWHNLEWDDESYKNSLTSHFIPKRF